MSVVGSDEYVDFCEGLRQICGLDLSHYKRPQMERRLRSFLGSRGVNRLPDHLDVLRRDPAALDELLDRVTINVSQLWRHPEQWRVLERDVLPELVDGDPAASLRAWSAGCSYGAEAFTLAAVCRRVLPGHQIRILGTDIDERMVNRARAAIFSTQDIREAPLDELVTAFEPIDEGGWRAREELRRMARFERSDLLQILPRRAAFDLILCRNTVIYFAEAVRDDLHARLAHALRPGGYLVVGATERVAEPAALGLELVRPFFYRRA